MGATALSSLLLSYVELVGTVVFLCFAVSRACGSAAVRR
jgi:hypothetical protein